MVDKNHSVARRSAALLATVCTLGSLTVTPIANAAPEPEPTTTQQTTNQPQGNADVNANADGANEADAVANVATVTSPDGQTTSYPTFSAALAASKAGETVTLTANSDESTVRVDKKITVTSVNGAVYSGTMTVHDGATIKGMTFSLTGAAGSNTSVSVQGAGDVKIEGNAFGIAENAAVTGYYGVYVQKGSARVSINNNTFNYPTAAKNHNRTAIYLTGQENTVTDVTVANNTMKVTGAASNKGQTIFIDASGGRNDYGITNLTVTGNTVSATAETKNNATGIYVQGVKGLTFTDNTFTNLSQAVGSGAMPGQNTTSTDIKVGGNDFTGTDTGYGFEKGSVPPESITVTKPDKVEASKPSQHIMAGVQQADGSVVAYPSLADAIADAASDSTVVLFENAPLTQPITVNKKIVIDAQGHNITGNQLKFGAGSDGSAVKNAVFYGSSAAATATPATMVLIDGVSGVQVTDNTFVMFADTATLPNKVAGVTVQAENGKTATGTVLSGNTFKVSNNANSNENNIGVQLLEEQGGTISNTAVSGNTFDVYTGVSINANGNHTTQAGSIAAISGNTFNGEYAVIGEDGLDASKFSYSSASGNTFAKGTVPYFGDGQNAKFYGVTYVDNTDNLSMLTWEIVAKDGTVANVPSKAGYTANLYTKDANNQYKSFNASADKVTGNLTLYVTFTSNGGNGGNGGGTVTPSYPSAPEVVSKPNKLEYKIGEEFDSTGMVVKYQNHVLGSDQYTVTLDTSKPGKVKVFITLNSDPTKATSFEVTVVVSDLGVHRLYNKWNGEHFYTANDDEYRSLKKAGWTDEGTAFTMADYGTPVYRLYLSGGKHLFTTSEKERDALKAAGWRDEGIAFYVRDDGTAKTEVYRLYNPGNGDHLLTTNANERGVLALNKWRVEGTAFQAK